MILVQWIKDLRGDPVFGNIPEPFGLVLGQNFVMAPRIQPAQTHQVSLPGDNKVRGKYDGVMEQGRDTLEWMRRILISFWVNTAASVI